ncbi:class I SAM-dependent methyltransferase [Actinacidiphila acidipaludis]|uniref:Class I SAM-dependent methyltransferase n=1 Tax=Actinacidiphila acidipaludis TaxID=2873382 RepID=A0ABS7Q8I8_9ACTN|nr:class I SAM-dependent methyltransferase [Streptomyces acidipaludis]MBY8879151.1 class I SAM-dependent methyltransferase [Streptomyces acidipaludis]
MSAENERIKVELEGVPETLLWNLYNRAEEARRPGSRLLDDPRAVELVDRIDYPFERFGAASMAQWHALRIRCLDDEVRRFLAERPGGTVVALGEGLETQFWRVDDGRVRWLSVDLPETVEVRRTLLPDDPPRRRSLACSALDLRWMDEVGDGVASRDVMVTAQGLLMYLPEAEAKGLIAACAERFPGGRFLFDALPRAMVARNQAGALGSSDGRYRAPRWEWGMDVTEYRKVAAASPRITEVRSLRFPRGRGLYALAPLSHRIPGLRSLRMSIIAVRFGGDPGSAE